MSTPPLTAEQERLVLDNQRLIPFAIAQLAPRGHHPGEDDEDDISAGQLGLIHAARIFDPAKGRSRRSPSQRSATPCAKTEGTAAVPATAGPSPAGSSGRARCRSTPQCVEASTSPVPSPWATGSPTPRPNPTTAAVPQTCSPSSSASSRNGTASLSPKTASTPRRSSASPPPASTAGSTGPVPGCEQLTPSWSRPRRPTTTPSSQREVMGLCGAPPTSRP